MVLGTSSRICSRCSRCLAVIRWMHFNAPHLTDSTTGTSTGRVSAARILAGCLAETLGFHLGVLASSAAVLVPLRWYQARSQSTTNPSVEDKRQAERREQMHVSGTQAEFRYSLIPLTLLYSSLTKLFLLFLLSIWRPASSSATQAAFQISTSAPGANLSTPSILGLAYLDTALRFLDDEFLGRDWVVRNGLGGLSAGFGLRVVLSLHPLLTSLIIFAGWVSKTAVVRLVGRWVGGGAEAVWLAYSIP